jgi:hypothetical protein
MHRRLPQLFCATSNGRFPHFSLWLPLYRSFFPATFQNIPEFVMSDVRRNWQRGIQLGIMPRSMVWRLIMPYLAENDE